MYHTDCKRRWSGIALGIWLLLLPVVRTMAGETHHFLQLGSSFGRMSVTTDQLKQFQQTYNQVNSRYQVNGLSGFDNVEGLGWEVGYRHQGRWNFCLSTGVFNLSKKDAASYSNGDSRTIEMEIRQYFLEYHHQVVQTRDLFFDLFVSFFFHRKIHLTSYYNGSLSYPKPKTITGKYQSNPIFATDVGVTVGLIFQPVLLSLRFYYPVYSNGKKTLIRDSNPEKVAAGVDAFPADYEAFVYLNTYTPMTGQIDGWKIMLNIQLLLEIFKKKK